MTTTPVLSPTQQRVLETRYLQPGEKTWEDVCKRVANFVGQNEPNDIVEKFYEMMVKFQFVPSSPVLMNAGTELGDLAACYVLPVEDSMESIFQAIYDMAMIQRAGGGTGFDFSKLRPAGAVVKSTASVASGPISFMRIFNAATGEIKQGGRRRGANMGVLRVDHPDIIDFIHAKATEGVLSNFNISVGITNEFMRAAINDGTLLLTHPYTGPVREVKAAEILQQIAEQAHATGDPGLLFLDTINEFNPTPWLGPIESTNPCGETPLLANEPCVLGSLNLTHYDKPYFGALVELAVRFLDDVVDVGIYANDNIKQAAYNTRKIGLGVMGFADWLVMREIPYDSPKALDQALRIMKGIQELAHYTSRALAKQRGVAPALTNPDQDGTTSSPFIGMRNAQCIVIAPTGSISMIAGVNSGIEPFYSLATVYKHQMDYIEGGSLARINTDLKDVSNRIMEHVLNTGRWPQDDKRWPIYKTAHEISWEMHVRMQSAFQHYTDGAVSKTINLPATASVEDVRHAYLMAYTQGCKGVTVYRDGSKSSQVLNVPKEPNISPTFVAGIIYGETHDGVIPGESGEIAFDKPNVFPGLDTTNIPGIVETFEEEDREPILLGFTHKVRTGIGSLYVTVNERDGKPVELLATIGHAGTETAAFTEGLARMVSMALQYGIPVDDIAHHLIGIGGSNVAGFGKDRVLSVPDAIGKVLQGAHTILAPLDEMSDATVPTRLDICPQCLRGNLEYQEGCCHCNDCGYSTC